MHEETLLAPEICKFQREIRTIWVHSLVVGSGAAGLNAAIQLVRSGVTDVVIVTEGLDRGTSINAGSDKQTYYKLSLCGDQTDSPLALAETLFAAGSMHGDLALVEAAQSARAFFNLVNLGVRFPQDPYGQFPGYKTDHDPRQRATSVGPYTSQEMCRKLIAEVRRLGIPVFEGRSAVAMLALREGETRCACGIITLNEQGLFEAFLSENTIFAVGGPALLYEASVYPPAQTGGIGIALLAGAKAQNLPESQFGLAATVYRWNVSGTYMQVVPRFVSQGDGGELREFLQEYFPDPGQRASLVFLKGYQWPFDARKVPGGSSMVDILVYYESVVRGRSVYLDYRTNPNEFSFASLSAEARSYLERSGAFQETPLERLRHMNPAAIGVFSEHGIDLAKEPLRIAVCSQHNNGGLAANRWWESLNVKHLFPIGEVNGSHGVARPGGASLNAGQVGGFRAAEFIAYSYRDWTVERSRALDEVFRSLAELCHYLTLSRESAISWQSDRAEFQRRMTAAGSHIRRTSQLQEATGEAWRQYQRIRTSGSGFAEKHEALESLRNLHLCFAHAVYLDAIRFALESGVGSRGSAIVVDPAGIRLHEKLPPDWAVVPENPQFRDLVLETIPAPEGYAEHRWVARRPIPKPDTWFETAWAAFGEGKIFEV